MTSALEHGEVVKAAVEAEGHVVTRVIETDGGDAFQLLIQPKGGEKDVGAIRDIVTGAGFTVAKDWQPAWLPLRKCVVVTCATPN